MRGLLLFLGAWVAASLVLDSSLCRSMALDPVQWRQKEASLQQQPVHVKADRMELRRQESLILYTGNVSVTQPQYRIYSDLLEVRWDPETRKISHLVAKGKVLLEAGDARASCGVAILDVAAQEVEMQESPRMTQAGEHVEGERILYSLSQKRSTVLGGRGGRVRTLVIPGGKR